MEKKAAVVRRVEESRARSSQLSFQLLVNVLDLTISTCKSVRLWSDVKCNLDMLHRQIRRAKDHYAKALIQSSRHRMAIRDVQLLEWRSHQLEQEIAALERRIRQELLHTFGPVACDTSLQQSDLSLKTRKSVVY